MEIIIIAGADVNASGGYNGSALQAAVFASNEIVEMLLNAGADVNAGGGHHGNALQAAAYCGRKETVEILIKAGTDVSALGGHYGSALQAAVATVTRFRDVIKVLSENPASVNLRSRASDGSRLLHAAVISEELGTLSHLLNAGAEELIKVKNVSGQTPFQLAVMSGNLRILEMLYLFSKDSNSIFEEKDVDGQTSPHLAVENEAVEVVEWCLDKGARADV